MWNVENGRNQCPVLELFGSLKSILVNTICDRSHIWIDGVKFKSGKNYN